MTKLDDMLEFLSDLNIDHDRGEAEISINEAERKILVQALGLVNNLLYEFKATPFICGTVGQKDEHSGLHDGYFVCPAFGSDTNEIFMRKK